MIGNAMATIFVPPKYSDYPLKNPIDNFSSKVHKLPTPQHPEEFPPVVAKHLTELDVPWPTLVPIIIT